MSETEREGLVEADKYTQDEFRKLVRDLVPFKHPAIKNSGGMPVSREAEYILPTGQTLVARELLDKDFDTGVEVVISESGISEDKKPYTHEHAYTVYDYGSTHQQIRVKDDLTERQAKYRQTTEGNDEEERELGLDRESQDGIANFEALTAQAGMSTISETELQDLVNKLKRYKNAGQLEPLPPADATVLKNEYSGHHEQPVSKSEDHTENAIKAAKSLIYQQELRTVEQASPEAVKELQNLIDQMTANGEVVKDQLEWGSDLEPFYRSSKYKLVDDREVELRKFFKPFDSLDQATSMIIMEGDGAIEEYFIGDNGFIEHAVNLEEDEPDDEESNFADDSDIDDIVDGIDLDKKMGIERVTQVELSKVVRLLKTAEPSSHQPN